MRGNETRTVMFWNVRLKLWSSSSWHLKGRQKPSSSTILWLSDWWQWRHYVRINSSKIAMAMSALVRFHLPLALSSFQTAFVKGMPFVACHRRIPVTCHVVWIFSYTAVRNSNTAYLNNFKISTGLWKVSFSFCDSVDMFLLHFW